MASDIKTAVLRDVCNTSLGNQSFSTADFGGGTPKAAFFIVSTGETDGVAAAHDICAIGCCDGTNQWSLSYRGEDARGTSTSCGRRHHDTDCIVIINQPNDTVDGAADFVSFDTNGVTVDWNDASGTAYMIEIWLFGGDDMQVDVATFTPGAEDTEVNVETVGFEADLLILGAASFIFNEGANAQTRFSIGFVENTGAGENQAAYCRQLRSGVTTTEAYGLVHNNRGISDMTLAGGAAARGEITTFDSVGFSHFSRDAAGTGEVGYLAIDTGDRDVYVGNFTTPTGTGEQPQTGPGFKPQMVGMVTTQLPTINTVEGPSGLAGTWCISGFTPDAEFCHGYAFEDGIVLGTSNSESVSDNAAVLMHDDAGGALMAAAFVSMDDAAGWTLNWSAVDSGNPRLQFGFAIEDAPAPGGFSPALLRQAQRLSTLLRM